MAWIKYNANPFHNDTGDCVIRAIATVMDTSWDEIYLRLVVKGFSEKEVFTRNNFWIDFLYQNGYVLHGIPDTCPDCITVEKFARGHPTGRYVLGTGTHAVAVVDGNYYDTADSGQEHPLYYFRKETP